MTGNDDQARIETMGIRLGYLGLLPLFSAIFVLSNELAPMRTSVCSVFLRSCHSGWCSGVGAHIGHVVLAIDL